MKRNNLNISTGSEKIASCLKALGHPIRLEIVRSLQDGPLCVGEIEKLIGTTQSNISQHLSTMKEAGILDTSRDKNQIYYSVENWRIFQLISMARDVFL